MDKESLALVIKSFDKNKFEKSAKIVLNDIFGLNAINETLLSVKKDKSVGDSKCVYCIMMNNTNSIDKSLLVKKIHKYNLANLYVFYKEQKTEAELAKLNYLYASEFGISVNCMCSRTIAGLLIEANKEGSLFDDGYEYRLINNTDEDYLAAAFHSFTIASPDVLKLKGQVYDDAILFKVSSSEYSCKEDLVNDVVEYLKLTPEKQHVLEKRVDSLMSKGQIRKDNGVFKLLDSVSSDIADRKKAYLYELNSLTSAQTDLMQEDYHISWGLEDSKKISTLLAFSAIEEKFKLLRDAKANIDHPILRFTKGCDGKIINYLKENKSMDGNAAVDALHDLAQLASSHPLIIKITRACMYMALEGINPLSAANALGASSWKDFQVLLEPTVAIPYICSRLYDGEVSKSFANSIRSVHSAISMTAGVKIPYFYINECAGHLLSARRYDDLNLDPEEMVHSKNAFVANYYSLLKSGAKLPASYMEYLATFSPAIKFEKSNIRQWVREIMTDLTSILMNGHVVQEFMPHYEGNDLRNYETDYSLVLDRKNKEKPHHLVLHDAMALKYINDKVAFGNEHWIILSYDSVLSEVGNNQHYNGWVCTPGRFLDMTQITQPLSETQMVSVLHNVASFGEKTLAVGAIIMDRIIQYSSADMKKWEFRQEIEKFKQEIKNELNNEGDINDKELIKRTDNFLKSKGIDIKEEDIEVEQPSVN